MAAQDATEANSPNEAGTLNSSTGGNEKTQVSNTLPADNHDNHGKRLLPRFKVDHAGESGRKGINPLQFFTVCFKSTTTISMIVNILWPFVPAAFAVHFARPDLHVWDFTLSYISMVPSANLLGFAGGELARKLPKTLGILVETTLASTVEIVLFAVLIVRDQHNSLVPVIQAAILGSILANLLLCLGLCFFVGGIRRHEQVFHEVISDTGSSLMLVAGFGLLIPSAFYSALSGSTSTEGPFTATVLRENTHTISRAAAILLMVAFFMYVSGAPFS